MANGNGSEAPAARSLGKVTYVDTKIEGPTGEWTIDADSAPLASVQALLSRGLSHIMGNEVAARVVGELRKQAIAAWKAENVGKELDAATKEAIEKGVKFDRDNQAHLNVQYECRREAHEAILAGTLSEGRERTPKLTPFEYEVFQIVHARVLKLVSNENLAGASVWAKGGHVDWKPRKLPEDETTFKVFGESATFQQLIDRYRVGKFQKEVEKEAQARLDAKARAAEKQAKLATEAGGAQDVGF